MFDFPNSPTNGQTVSGNNGATWAWDGSKWVASTNPESSSHLTVSDTPPTAPTNGSMWWDSANGQLYVYYMDVNSSQWVQANSLAGIGAFLALSGGTMTGPITLAGDPSAALQASTKQYVDTNVGHNVGRNLIHNGLFNVQQRGQGNWNTNTYTADRWYLTLNLDTTVVAIIPLTDAHRTAIGDEAARYGLQYNVTGNAGAASYSEAIHRIEGVRRLAGKTVTLSFYAQGPTGAKIGLSGGLSFGTGGSPTAPIGFAAQSVTLVAGFQRYSVTITMPSAQGATFGTNGDDNIYLQFWFSSGSTNNAGAGNIGVQTGFFVLWGVQLEVGSNATPLEHIDPRMDLANCQRFYQIGHVSFWTYTAAGNIIAQSWALPVVMRAVPTTTYNFLTANNITSQSLVALSNGYAQLYATASATGSTQMEATFTASADL